MTIYARWFLPRLLDLAMRNRAARAEREKFVPLASGAVLEVGVGSALNLPFYTTRIEALRGLDPSPELLRMARRRVDRAPFPVALLGGSGEELPAKDRTFDTVVTTWTLCTIPDPGRALSEMRRVLKPGGQLLFIEHGRSPDPRVLAWQDRLTPLWRRIGGGCHLNRKIDELILAAGFRITQLETGYTRGPKPFAYLYRGLALPPE